MPNLATLIQHSFEVVATESKEEKQKEVILYIVEILMKQHYSPK